MMGIRPNRDGLIPPVTPDNPETRYSDWLTDLEDSGGIVGGVWQETDAKATSANGGMSDLAGRLAELEAVTQVNGDGWRIYKRAGIVTLRMSSINGSFSIPSEFAPPVSIQSRIVSGAQSHDARFTVSPSGTVGLNGTYTTPISGAVTYVVTN